MNVRRNIPPNPFSRQNNTTTTMPDNQSNQKWKKMSNFINNFTENKRLFESTFSKICFSRCLAPPPWPLRNALNSDWSVVTKGRYQSVIDPREGESSFGLPKKQTLEGWASMTMSYCPPPPSLCRAQINRECSFGKKASNHKVFKVVGAQFFI